VRHAILRVGLVVLALIVGFLAGQRSVEGRHTDTRRFVPIPADVALRTFPVPSPTPIAGLHEYQRPIYVEAKGIPVPEASAAAPRSTTPPRARRDSSAAKVSGGGGRHHNLRGYATWHATGRDGWYAAAGPLLRQAIGKGWRGSQVLVCKHERCLEVTLNDVCFCKHGRRLVDLSDEAFRYLAPLSRGVIGVAVGW
jgi:hypothetical protein